VIDCPSPGSLGAASARQEKDIGCVVHPRIRLPPDASVDEIENRRHRRTDLPGDHGGCPRALSAAPVLSQMREIAERLVFLLTVTAIAAA